MPQPLGTVQEQFRYDAETAAKLERSLSTDRLGPYLQLADGKAIYAIRLYEWNTRVSEDLYSILQGFEVTLRNSIHEVLSQAYGQENWYDAAPLLPPERQRVADAKQRIRDDGRDVTPGRVVAELMFGFWTSLVGRAYAQILWDKHLYKAFRERRTARKHVARRLKKVRFLRNRVAHHESVIGRKNEERDLRKDVEEILETTGWICRTTARWISYNSSFDESYRKRPVPPEPELPRVPNEGPGLNP